MSAANTRLLESLPGLWSAHDVDGVVACFTEDCLYEDVVLRWEHRGLAELREFAANVFALLPDFRIRYTSVFATDAMGAAEWLIDATYTGEFEGHSLQGRPVSYKGVTVFALREGRILRNTDYWDYADWMRQLGVATLSGV